MWKIIFGNLTHPLIFSLVVLVVVSTVLIALRGKVRAKFGNKIIDIGKEDNESEQSSSLTSLIAKKRSCSDCILLLMGEREKYEFNIKRESNKILKVQMTFVEQKLEGVLAKYMDIFAEYLKNSTIDEIIQYKLLYGLLKDAILRIKDEIRRSFKDNGFWDVSAPEFSGYLRDRNIVIMSILIQYIRNMYPDKEGILGIMKIIRVIESKNSFLLENINDIYIYARDIKIETDIKIKNMQEQFIKWVDNFIK